MTKTDRNSILDAVFILNDILDALVAGTMVFDRYQSKYAEGEFSKAGIVAVQKMCVSHIVLALSRLIEFWQTYNRLVPIDLQPDVKAVVSKLQRRDLMQYRSTVVAHIRDKKLGRARTQFEAIEHLNRLSDNNPIAFLSWLNNAKDNSSQKTVACIVESMRDQICSENDVSAEEVFQR